MTPRDIAAAARLNIPAARSADHSGVARCLEACADEIERLSSDLDDLRQLLTQALLRRHIPTRYADVYGRDLERRMCAAAGVGPLDVVRFAEDIGRWNGVGETMVHPRELVLGAKRRAGWSSGRFR